MKKPRSWTLNVEEDAVTGDCYVQITEEILKESGMKIGDHLHWIDNRDGSFTLTREDLTTFIKKGIISNE